MSSLLDLIAEREAAATAAAEHLRTQIATLTEQLALAEGELADLATTRTTLAKLTAEAEARTPVDTTVASAPYQKILDVFTTATSGLRAKDVCLALDAGTTPKHTEGMRAKLKRLVARHILDELEPGLFTLAPAAPSA